MGAPTSDYNADVADGHVIGVNPPQGTAVAPDSAVTLAISKGHAPVKVPDVRGQAPDAAAAALDAVGLKSTRGDDAFSNDVRGRAGHGDDSRRRGQRRRSGQPCRYVVSKGPDLVDVPDVISQLLGPALRATAGTRVPGRRERPVAVQPTGRGRRASPGPQPRGAAITLTPG